MEDGATAPTMRNQAPLLLVSISYWINPSYFPILNVKVEPFKFPFLIILLNVSFFFLFRLSLRNSCWGDFISTFRDWPVIGKWDRWCARLMIFWEYILGQSETSLRYFGFSVDLLLILESLSNEINGCVLMIMYVYLTFFFNLVMPFCHHIWYFGWYLLGHVIIWSFLFFIL